MLAAGCLPAELGCLERNPLALFDGLDGVSLVVSSGKVRRHVRAAINRERDRRKT